MIRKEFEMPKSVLEDIMGFTFWKTNDFNKVTLSNKYEDMEINICLEKANKRERVITLYIEVVVDSLFPATFKFEFRHVLDFFKVYRLNFKSDDILLKITPQGGSLKEKEYILFRPLIENGMAVSDLTNMAFYISFNDELDLFYLVYNLLLNNHFIIFEPSNVRTDLNLKKFLIEKFDYYGYDEGFLKHNKHLKIKTSFGTSKEILDKLIVYVLEVLINNDKSELENTLLKHFYNVFYTLIEKEIEFNYVK